MCIRDRNTYIPRIEEVIAKDQQGNDIDCAVMLSPVCFPMHDHSEPSQGSQGGNYNCGMISGILFIGDRKGAGPGEAGVITFPMPPTKAENLCDHGPDCRPGDSGIYRPALAFRMPTIEMM